MASDDIRNLLKSGMEAARNGNKPIAAQIFRQVIDLDSQNEAAWFWLASVLDSPAERERALQRVLTINPNNERAQQILEKLGTQRRGTTSMPPPVGVSPAPPPKEAPAPPTKAPEVKPTPPPPITEPSQFFSDTPPPHAATPPPPDFPRPQAARRGGMSAPLYYGGIALALVLIGIALFLAVQSTSDDSEGSGATVQTNATPTLGTPLPPTATLPPTPTPRPRNTLSPDNVIIEGGSLPATWTPSPTHTALPTHTATPEPSDPSNFELIFSRAASENAAPRLWLVSGDGSNQRELTIDLTQVEAGGNPLSGNEGISDPAFSPDGAFLALTIQINPSLQEVFLLNLQSNRLRQLTTLGMAIADGATWSSDGQSIAISAGEANGGITDIYVVDVDNGAATRVTNGTGQNREPAWSPSSNQLVFASDQATPGELEIWSVASPNARPEQLTNAVNTSFSPAFSSDGTRIAFISNRGGDNDLYVMNADGSDEKLLSINDNNAEDLDPAWSPDDNWIMVSSTQGGEPVPQLWVVDPLSITWRKVTDNQTASRAADWRPINEG